MQEKKVDRQAVVHLSSEPYVTFYTQQKTGALKDASFAIQKNETIDPSIRNQDSCEDQGSDQEQQKDKGRGCEHPP